MKKLLAFLLILVMCLSVILVACDDSQTEDNNSTEEYENESGKKTEEKTEKATEEKTESESPCDVHVFGSATCSKPQTCYVCGKTQGETLEHTWVDADCDEPIHCLYCDATEGDPIGHTWDAATCQTPKTCSVCKATEGDVINHIYENNYCTMCETIDKNSDEYKYQFLKKKADGIAFSCARTAVRNQLKNPTTMEVISEEILDSDDYFRYIIKIDYTAENEMGGTVTSYANIMIRVNPEMDGTFYHTQNSLGWVMSISETQKTEWGWGNEPEDWSLDAATKYTNPEEVSIKLILANPGKYAGKYVKIKEQLKLTSNDLSEKKFRTYQSTGTGFADYNSDNSIYVFYSMADNVDDCIMLDANRQNITVIGEVKVYSNSTDPYIDAYEIIFE